MGGTAGARAPAAGCCRACLLALASAWAGRSHPAITAHLLPSPCLPPPAASPSPRLVPCRSWQLGAEPSLDWTGFLAKKNAELHRLNGIYLNLLKNSGVEVRRRRCSQACLAAHRAAPAAALPNRVGPRLRRPRRSPPACAPPPQYIEGRGKLVDAHTVDVGGKRVTAKNILVATGARAFVPTFEGSELCMISDDALEVQEVGAGIRTLHCIQWRRLPRMVCPLVCCSSCDCWEARLVHDLRQRAGGAGGGCWRRLHLCAPELRRRARVRLLRAALHARVSSPTLGAGAQEHRDSGRRVHRRRVCGHLCRRAAAPGRSLRGCAARRAFRSWRASHCGRSHLFWPAPTFSAPPPPPRRRPLQAWALRCTLCTAQTCPCVASMRRRVPWDTRQWGRSSAVGEEAFSMCCLVYRADLSLHGFDEEASALGAWGKLMRCLWRLPMCIECGQVGWCGRAACVVRRPCRPPASPPQSPAVPSSALAAGAQACGGAVRPEN